MDFLRRSTLASLAGLCILTAFSDGMGTALADTTGPVLLTVQGSLGEQALRLSDLDSLPQHRFTTSTIWTTEPMEFSGPALADVLASSGLGGQDLRLRAANDYSITLKPLMVEGDAPIVATRINGKPFGLRDRGPLWLVFPYDADARFRTEHTFAASIWQLTDIRADSTP